MNRIYELAFKHQQGCFYGLWAAMLIWLMVQTGGFAMRWWLQSGRIEESVRQWQQVMHSAAPSTKAGSRAGTLASQGALFAPPPGKPPLPKCMAILGDAVLINDQWYKVGSQVQGVKILEILPQAVRVEQDGQEHKLVPFESQPEQEQRDRAARSERGDARSGTAASVRAENRPSPSNVPSAPGTMTAEQRRLYERYQNASPQERARLRDEFRRNRGQ
ncbi:MAG TPA: hypothetical protein PK052_05770 [Anaerohalosphaeraceae bacterium]|nr:hypothetical protein [Phycisphaerae bacterium]HOK95498.1 hypothetical protein [Anaerohalosphaeraceae bacterium]HOL31474.1 hypothetical protein [Anaerohalosphaeraceae bacterium]HOM76820.1 hypothetical protein [Anaerohalosphaeraceae bacterium]HPC64486.1 hypothetical protein [Anaerohalosphaeraceae bacterium]